MLLSSWWSAVYISSRTDAKSTAKQMPKVTSSSLFHALVSSQPLCLHDMNFPARLNCQSCPSPFWGGRGRPPIQGSAEKSPTADPICFPPRGGRGCSQTRGSSRMPLYLKSATPPAWRHPIHPHPFRAWGLKSPRGGHDRPQGREDCPPRAFVGWGALLQQTRVAQTKEHRIPL